MQKRVNDKLNQTQNLALTEQQKERELERAEIEKYGVRFSYYILIYLL